MPAENRNTVSVVIVSRIINGFLVVVPGVTLTAVHKIDPHKRGFFSCVCFQPFNFVHAVQCHGARNYFFAVIVIQKLVKLIGIGGWFRCNQRFINVKPRPAFGFFKLYVVDVNPPPRFCDFYHVFACF